MKNRYSAGGVIVRKTGGNWQVLLICDMNGSWTFPKGQIETGETKIDAARREISEEVCLNRLNYRRSLGKISYIFHKHGLIQKTVWYYLFDYPGQEKPQPNRREGISASKWVTLDQAEKIIGYPDNSLVLLSKVCKYLDHYGR